MPTALPAGSSTASSPQRPNRAPEPPNLSQGDLTRRLTFRPAPSGSGPFMLRYRSRPVQALQALGGVEERRVGGDHPGERLPGRRLVTRLAGEHALGVGEAQVVVQELGGPLAVPPDERR